MQVSSKVRAKDDSQHTHRAIIIVEMIRLPNPFLGAIISRVLFRMS